MPKINYKHDPQRETKKTLKDWGWYGRTANDPKLDICPINMIAKVMREKKGVRYAEETSNLDIDQLIKLDAAINNPECITNKVRQSLIARYVLQLKGHEAVKYTGLEQGKFNKCVNSGVDFAHGFLANYD